MRCAVCRCFRGAFLSVSRIWSTNATAAASFHRGRSTFFRRAGIALPIASRTIRRCTFSFFATPAIVPMPNSYSLRICSNSSTFVLQSTKFLRSGLRPFQSTRSFQRVGQNKLPNWAISKYRNQKIFQSIAVGVDQLAAITKIEKSVVNRPIRRLLPCSPVPITLVFDDLLNQCKVRFAYDRIEYPRANYVLRRSLYLTAATLTPVRSLA